MLPLWPVLDAQPEVVIGALACGHRTTLRICCRFMSCFSAGGWLSNKWHRVIATGLACIFLSKSMQICKLRVLLVVL